MMNRNTKRTLQIAALLTLWGAGLACAAEATIPVETEVFYPVGHGGRSGGTASMGAAHMERLDHNPAGPVIQLSAEKGPAAGAWWFPNHARLNRSAAMIGVPGAQIAFDIKSAKPVQTKFSFQWRGDGNATGPAVHSEVLDLSPDKLTHVQFDLPDPGTSDDLGGLILTFDKPGEYQISRIALTEPCKARIDPLPPADPRKVGDLAINGKAADGVQRVTVRLTPEAPDPLSGITATARPIEKTVAVKQSGAFSLTVPLAELAPACGYRVSAYPQGQSDQASPAVRTFVFPQLTNTKNPPVTRRGSELMCDGKPFGFVGVNYTRFDLGLGNHADYEVLAKDVLQMKDWGVRVVRMPMNVGLMQPEPGVFPDNPKYADLLKQHKLDPRYVDQIDYFVQLAGQNGIYCVVDWHSTPDDPYRYFVGGVPADKGTGKPGTAISYLAPSTTQGAPLDLSNPLHLKTLMDMHRWTAAHFKGNPNILGFEVPHNEPHSKWAAIESNWRFVTDQCAKAVAEGDPDRLTFAMAPAYSHDNLLPSDTWLPPDRVSGAAPHFYQANGPVALRPDAKKFKSPWLARDPEATFGWGFPSVAMPLSAVKYPFYNGESGRYGHQTLLPDDPDGARILTESQFFQEYAAGMTGGIEWTLWGNKGDFTPYVQMYRQQFQRYAPVYASGPLDRSKAEVAFVQSAAADKSGNGYNYACVPLAKAALDAHLSPVHYLNDEQFRYLGSATVSVGLEQVVEMSERMQYKAYVVDKRNLDPRVEDMLKKTNAKVLWLDSADDLTGEKLADFLKSAGVSVDTKTPRSIQLVEGPAYLLAYRRLAGDPDEATIYPQLRHAGKFRLVDESGKKVFEGTAVELADVGLPVHLSKWRSAIFKISE